MRESRVPESPCPHCGKKLDAAADPLGTATPSPGDLTLCLDCGEMSEIGADLRLGPLSPGALERIENLIAVQRAHRIRAAYQEWKRHKVRPVPQ